MNHEQLTDPQRYQIEAYPKANHTIAQIALGLGVNKGTISRELERNSKKRGHSASYAAMLSKGRKQESCKGQVFDGNMEHCIDRKLITDQWPPEQIKGRCDLDSASMVSIERIHQYIHKDQPEGGTLYLYPRTARGWRKKRLNRKQQRGQTPNRVMMGQRPPIVGAKERFGDWE